MNLASIAINKRFFTSFITVLLCILGISGYFTLGKLEDPAFTVKVASVVTLYPGASAEEVEQRVTDVVERKIQEMGKLWKLRSISRPGQSIVMVELYETTTGDELPQQWDLLRRKVNDVKLELPSEVRISFVIDEFSEVYGMLFAVTGDGIPPREMNHYARMLQRDLKAVDGVNKVQVQGLNERKLYVELDQAKLDKLRLTRVQVLEQLRSQSLILNPGTLTIDNERIRLSQTGTLDSVEDIENLSIRADFANIGQDRFRLKDIARVYEGDVDTPLSMSRYNGKPALIVSVNPQDGFNVVAMGDTLRKAVSDFEAKVPAGVEVGTIVFQPDEVQRSISSFVMNLISSVLIVVVILWIFMGRQSSLIVGSSLTITLLLTLVYMMLQGIDLHRVSVGTFILALGMLVDNAIVITDLFGVKVRHGVDRFKAAVDSVKETQVPLLAATLIAIVSTTPVLMSQTAAAEFAIDLVYIMASSLLLSWIIAITVTPLLCWKFLKFDDDNQGEPDWYGKARPLVAYILNNRKKVVSFIGLSMVAAGIMSQAVTLNFMPSSDRPIVFVDYWQRQGGDFAKTSEDMAKIEQWLMEQPEVEQITSFIGGGAPRFTVTYEPEANDPAYGQVLVNVKSLELIPELRRRGDAWLKANLPDADPRFRPLKLATVDKFNVEAEFHGPDPVVLRQLADEAKAIMADHPNIKYIRDDWRQPTKVLKPRFNPDKASRAGVTRTDVSLALSAAAEGLPISLVYDGADRLPLVMRLSENDRNDISVLMNLPVKSMAGTYSVPLGQVIDGFDLAFEEGQILRRDRIRSLTVQADVEGMYASQARKDIAAAVEAIDLPAGYKMRWGGEYYHELRTVMDILMQLPKSGIVMLILMAAMFNGMRQPMVIILTLPLALIGVIPMLMVSGFPFGFMALVGVISLVGMIIKNGIVLMDQINMEIANGLEPFDALVESAVNRTMAISMAALTTALGMIPLWWDPLFGPMSATIIGGLIVATMLTLLIMPAFYAILFKVPAKEIHHDA